MADLFKTRQQAIRHFSGKQFCDYQDETDIECCECCGSWTVSQAIDDRDGGIVGPWCIYDSQGFETDVLFSRVCVECCDLSEIDARNMAGI